MHARQTLRRGVALAMLPLTLGIGGAQAERLGTMRPAEPLTLQRIAMLPAAQRPAWRAYLERSQRLMAADKAALLAERRALKAVAPGGAKEGSTSSMPLDRAADWYAGPEARAIAANIVSFQTPAGGWGKNQDRTTPPRAPGQFYVPVEKLPAYAKDDIQALDQSWRYVGTIDNGATLTELRFLARVQAVASSPAIYRTAFARGVRYLLDAQFPNGGWPQVYPLQGGYHDAITYNDNALSQVALLLFEIGRRDGVYAFVPADTAAAASAAARRATRLILDTQVRVAGKRTIWGQQHDALSGQPAGARNFEPAALSTAESVDLLRYLMRQPDRTAEVERAVADGVAWLNQHALRDVEWAGSAKDPVGRKLVAKPGAGPIWARYYDLRTGKPVFGDRDRVIYSDVNEVSVERRNGYSWFNTSPAGVIAQFEKWQARR